MRVFISYKQQGEDRKQLDTILDEISKMIYSTGCETFNYRQDIGRKLEKPLENEKLIKRCFFEIEKSDAVFAFVASPEKSEGMLLELGYASALNKKIILGIDKKFDSEYLRFVRSLANQVIEFEDFSDLSKRLNRKNFVAGDTRENA